MLLYIYIIRPFVLLPLLFFLVEIFILIYTQYFFTIEKLLLIYNLIFYIGWNSFYV